MTEQELDDLWQQIRLHVKECLVRVLGENRADQTPSSSDSDGWSLSQVRWRMECRRIDSCLDDQDNRYRGAGSAIRTSGETYTVKVRDMWVIIANALMDHVVEVAQ